LETGVETALTTGSEVVVGDEFSKGSGSAEVTEDAMLSGREEITEELKLHEVDSVFLGGGGGINPLPPAEGFGSGTINST
jgi:hypothetical protein